MTLRMDMHAIEDNGKLYLLWDETHNCILDEWAIFSSDEQDEMRNDMRILGFNV